MRERGRGGGAREREGSERKGEGGGVRERGRGGGARERERLTGVCV